MTSTKVINLGNTCEPYNTGLNPVSQTPSPSLNYSSGNYLYMQGTNLSLFNSASDSLVGIIRNGFDIGLKYSRDIPAQGSIPAGDPRLRILYTGSSVPSSPPYTGYPIVQIDPSQTGGSFSSFTILSLNSATASANFPTSFSLSSITLTSTSDSTSFYLIQSSLPFGTKNVLSQTGTQVDLNLPANVAGTAGSFCITGALRTANTTLFTLKNADKTAISFAYTISITGWNNGFNGIPTGTVTIAATSYDIVRTRPLPDPNANFNVQANLTAVIFKVVSPAQQIANPVLGYNGTNTPQLGNYLTLSVNGISSYFYMFNENTEISSPEIENSQFLLLTSDRNYYLAFNGSSLQFIQASGLSSSTAYFSTAGFWSIVKQSPGASPTTSQFKLVYTSTVGTESTISVDSNNTLGPNGTPIQFTCMICTPSTLGGYCF